jgi:hypothetical protein
MPDPSIPLFDRAAAEDLAGWIEIAAYVAVCAAMIALFYAIAPTLGEELAGGLAGTIGTYLIIWIRVSGRVARLPVRILASRFCRRHGHDPDFKSFAFNDGSVLVTCRRCNSFLFHQKKPPAC